MYVRASLSNVFVGARCQSVLSHIENVMAFRPKVVQELWNKLVYVCQKQLGHTSRHSLWSLLQHLYIRYSICFKQTIMSGTDFKQCTHKGGELALAEKDKSEGQASNNDTYLKTNVFLQSMRSRPHS